MIRASILIRIAAALTFAMLDAGARATCFDESSNAGLKFPLIVNANVPLRSSAAPYRFYPASTFVSLDLRKLTKEPHPLYWFHWANRCQSREACGGNPKGNVPPSGMGENRESFRTFFSTHERADECTLRQAEAAFAPSASALASETGLRIVSVDALKDGSFSGHPLTDVCPLPPKAAPDVRGAMLDYEVQDGRTPPQTLAFLRKYAALLHGFGKEVQLYTNPLNAPTQRKTGIDRTNAHAIYDLVDASSLLLWSGNREGRLEQSLADQLDILRAGGPVDTRRTFLVYELAGTSLADAAFVHAEMSSGKFKALMLWRNGAEVGGDCDTESSRKIACVAFGRCGP